MAQPSQSINRRLRDADDEQNRLSPEAGKVDLLPRRGRAGGAADGLIPPRLQAGSDPLKNARFILGEHGEERTQARTQSAGIRMSVHVTQNGRWPRLTQHSHPFQRGRPAIRCERQGEGRAHVPFHSKPVCEVGIRRVRLIKEQCGKMLSPAGRADPNLLLMLVVGWYFIVQSWIEDDAVAASRAILDAASG